MWLCCTCWVRLPCAALALLQAPLPRAPIHVPGVVMGCTPRCLRGSSACPVGPWPCCRRRFPPPPDTFLGIMRVGLKQLRGFGGCNDLVFRWVGGRLVAGSRGRAAGCLLMVVAGLVLGMAAGKCQGGEGLCHSDCALTVPGVAGHR